MQLRNKSVRSLIRFLINSNIFLALGAICATDCYSIFYPNDHRSVFLLIGCGTLLVYNLHRLVKYYGGRYPEGTAIFSWTSANIRVIWIIAVISLFTILAICKDLETRAILFLGLPGLMAILYTLPLLRFRKKWYALRDIPLIKAAVVALVWSYLTVWYPQLYQTGEFFWRNKVVWIFFAGRFALFFILTVLADIRDLGVDRKSLLTLPQIAGIAGTKMILAGLLVLVALSGSICWFTGYLDTHLFVAFLFAHVVLAGFIYRAGDRDSHEFFYTAGVDGILILQWLLAGVSAVLL